VDSEETIEIGAFSVKILLNIQKTPLVINGHKSQTFSVDTRLNVNGWIYGKESYRPKGCKTITGEKELQTGRTICRARAGNGDVIDEFCEKNYTTPSEGQRSRWREYDHIPRFRVFEPQDYTPRSMRALALLRINSYGGTTLDRPYFDVFSKPVVAAIAPCCYYPAITWATTIPHFPAQTL
jgi:hypothetical protein